MNLKNGRLLLNLILTVTFVVNPLMLEPVFAGRIIEGFKAGYRAMREAWSPSSVRNGIDEAVTDSVTIRALRAEIAEEAKQLDEVGLVPDSMRIESFGLFSSLSAKAKDLPQDAIIDLQNRIDELGGLVERGTDRLAIISGDKGVGKSALIIGLAKQMPDAHFIEVDLGAITQFSKDERRFEKFAEYLSKIKSEKSNEKNFIFVFSNAALFEARDADTYISLIRQFDTQAGHGRSGVVIEGSREQAQVLLKSSTYMRAAHVVEFAPQSETTIRRIIRAQADKIESEARQQLAGVLPTENVGLRISDEMLERFHMLCREHFASEGDPAGTIQALRIFQGYRMRRFKNEFSVIAEELKKKLSDKKEELASIERKMPLNPFGLKLKYRKHEIPFEIKEIEDAIVKENAFVRKKLDAQAKINKILQDVRERNPMVISAAEQKEIDEHTARLEEVSIEEISEFLYAYKKVPIQEILAPQCLSELEIEKKLNESVFGQEAAVRSVLRVIRNMGNELRNSLAPLSSFVFAGPTGVGKTELAISLANSMGRKLHRVDMGEFSESHQVARLIGAPPGYIGHGDEATRTFVDEVIDNPNLFLLLDEVDKAHPSIYKAVLLQILDASRGALTDGQGRKANFSNTILVMTTNQSQDELYEKFLQAGRELGLASDDVKKIIISSGLFPKEVAGRVNNWVYFAPPTVRSLSKIIEKELARINRVLETRQIELNLTAGAKYRLARRVKQNKVESSGRAQMKKMEEIVVEKFGTLIRSIGSPEDLVTRGAFRAKKIGTDGVVRADQVYRLPVKDGDMVELYYDKVVDDYLYRIVRENGIINPI